MTSGSVVKSATAADRQRAFAKARWNTLFVRLFRKVLPVGAFALLAIYVASAFNEFEIGTGTLSSLSIPQITTQDLTMKNPRYSGFTTDGGRYEVTAASARQDFSVKNRIELQGISGTLTGADDAVTKLAADQGKYATDSGILELSGKIQVVSTQGLSAELSAARIETKSQVIESDKPVSVQMNENRIDSNALSISQKERRALFSGGVTALLHPPAPAPASAGKDAGSPAPAGDATGQNAMGALMSTSNGPVTVTSQKLTVDDASGRASFETGVVARQAETEITTDVLAVDYTSNAAQAAGAPAAAGAGTFGRASDVRAILSPGPLVIRRGDGQTVTAGKGTFEVAERRALLEGGVELSNGTSSAKGRTATFDAGQDLAVLDGGVEISAGPGRSARAGKAEFWSQSDRARLTGNVVVAQGDNVLEGGELVIDRQAGKVRLATPAGTGAKAGRVAARLAPQSASPGAKPSQKPAASPLGTFRADPNAPVTIEASRLDVDDRSKKAVFSGDVVAVQGTFKMNAGRLTAAYEGAAALGDAGAPLAAAGSRQAATARPAAETRIREIRADAKVVMTSAEGQTAEGDWATFDTAKNTVVLGGDVILRQGKSVLRGTRLVVDLTSGRTSLTTDGQKPAGGWATSANPKTVGEGTGAIASPQGRDARGSRPSALFFPQDLRQRGGGAGAAGQGGAGGGWSARTSPQ